jgi:hypothetical protein
MGEGKGNNGKITGGENNGAILTEEIHCFIFDSNSFAMHPAAREAIMHTDHTNYPDYEQLHRSVNHNNMFEHLGHDTRQNSDKQGNCFATSAPTQIAKY